MTEMQKKMQELISQEELDRAFDARFPKEMQVKLRAAKVAVAGIGGLGSNIAVMLARSGVGHLLLVDFDVVDVTNLNRQMYFISQLRKPKTEALLETLYQINPYLTYETVQTKVTPDNVKELFGGYPIVCEAFDKPDQKAMSGCNCCIRKWHGRVCRYECDKNAPDDAPPVCVRGSEH